MPDPNPPVDLSRYDFGVYDPPMSEQTPIPADVYEAAWRAYLAAEPPAEGRISGLIDTVYAAGVAAGRTPAAEDVPGWAHEYGVSFDGDTHWLECDFCSAPVKPVEAGDSLEEIFTKARDHRRICAAARVAENGADHAR